MTSASDHPGLSGSGSHPFAVLHRESRSEFCCARRAGMSWVVSATPGPQGGLGTWGMQE